MCSVEASAGSQGSSAADPSPARPPEVVVAPPLTIDVAPPHDPDRAPPPFPSRSDPVQPPPPISCAAPTDGACCSDGHSGGGGGHALQRRRSGPPASPGPFRRTSLPDPRSRSRTQEMVADHQSIQHLFENNRRWRDHKKSVEPAFFERTAEKQTPRYLWIGCSDSRVPAEEITGLSPGEMFVHRNIANMVVSNDISALSVIQYAVEKLRVKDIIVCGHYGCGGVLAAMENKTLGLLDNWLRNIRDVCRLYQPDLVAIANEKERFRRIVELNIIEQCLNIFKINMVQRHQIKYGFPRIHGVVYDIQTGELKELNIDFHGYLRKFSGIYRLHSFPTDDLPKSRSQLRVNIVRYLVEGHEEDEGRVSVRYITRALKAEKELFEVDEVDEVIAYAKEMVGDDTSPFINTNDIIEFFTEDDDEADSTTAG